MTTTDLREAATRFTAHYQPIVDLASDAVVGFEALARRIEADGSARPAGALIEAIEQDPEALPVLIRAMLAAVRRDMVPLFDRHRDFYVSINVPPMVLGRDPRGELLAALELMPYLSRLVIEVTERQALTEIGRNALDNARRVGIRVAVDDFGTGHSGLLQIVGMELDMLKIDRSLIGSILTNRQAARMLRGVVALAAALHMRTVAEGVEGWQDAFFLRAAGVDYGQGWYWSKALPAAEAARLLQTGLPPARSDSGGWRAGGPSPG
jgi:sensor c-di-GMP phosphodiesterase-like protein